MSKITLTPNASGTGTFTIASPNSNTNRTLTLPDSDGTLLHDSSSLSAANVTGSFSSATVDGTLDIEEVYEKVTTKRLLQAQ